MLVWKSFGIQHVAACSLAENRERFNICCENLVLDQIGVFSLPVFWWFMDIIGTKKNSKAFIQAQVANGADA